MSIGESSSTDQPDARRPGRVRTWWHPLFARLLEWLLGDAYRVEEEVSVGQMPLRLDVTLLRRGDREVSERSRRELPSLAACLNDFTLIEFKGPTDDLQRGDLDQFIAGAHLFRSQQGTLPPRTDLTLILVAPRITPAFRDDVQNSDLALREHEPGVHALEGTYFAMWVVESDRVAGPKEPILTLLSRVFLRNPRHIIEQWKRSGHDDVLFYVMQQIQQFQRLGEAFSMQHQGFEHMSQTLEELKAAVIAELPPEDRLKGIPLEDRLRGLSAEEVLKALSEEERKRLIELAIRQTSQADE